MKSKGSGGEGEGREVGGAEGGCRGCAIPSAFNGGCKQLEVERG